MTSTPSALTLQMLEWSAERPRTYEEAMEGVENVLPTAFYLGRCSARSIHDTELR
jgi:hypothetical protein